jgi:anaerobic ribonucleoside-triphosphate reductase activating protein
LGGEPLCPQNAENVIDIITAVREKYPDIKIFIWTGYKYENLPSAIKEGISKVDYIIDGQYEEDKRDIALYLRGSTNQRILKRNIDF